MTLWLTVDFPKKILKAQWHAYSDTSAEKWVRDVLVTCRHIEFDSRFWGAIEIYVRRVISILSLDFSLARYFMCHKTEVTPRLIWSNRRSACLWRFWRPSRARPRAYSPRCTCRVSWSWNALRHRFWMPRACASRTTRRLIHSKVQSGMS